MNNELKVEKKLIAYFDILGYKEIINEKVEENKENEFLKTVKEIVDISKLKKIIHSNNINNLTMQIFSDNFIICEKFFKNDVAYFEDFLMLIENIQCSIISKLGVFVRGYITIGNIYLDNEFVFGSGLIKAVEGESKAKYPIIEIDEVFMKFIKNTDFPNLVIRYNGKNYLNFLNTIILDPYEDIKNKNLKVVKEQIEKAVKRYGKIKGNVINEDTALKKESVIKKYLWLVRFYNKCVDKKYKINYELKTNERFNCVEIELKEKVEK